MMIDHTITHKTVNLYKQKDQKMSGKVQVIILTTNKTLLMLKVTIRDMQEVQTIMQMAEVRGSIKKKKTWLMTTLKAKNLERQRDQPMPDKRMSIASMGKDLTTSLRDKDQETRDQPIPD
jgi:hypothetical protein